MKAILKKYLIAGTVLVIALLGITIGVLTHKNTILQNNLSSAMINLKAYVLENSELKDKTRVFEFTIDLLNYYNDSLLMKMDSVRKELKIKDNNLKAMLYLLSEALKKDTIVFRDTIFIDPELDIDTTLGNEWYNISVGLKYPNTITTEPTFKSEKYVVVDYRKETIKPPKKCWLARLFQRKHKVVEVLVIEKNPYITNKQLRFVEIINKKKK